MEGVSPSPPAPEIAKPEAPTPQKPHEQIEQKLAGVSRRVRVNSFLDEPTRGVVNEHKDKITDPETLEQAEKILAYNPSADVSPEHESEALRAIAVVLPQLKNPDGTLDEGAQRILAETMPYIQVKIGTGDTARFLTHEEFEKELSNTATPEERAKLLVEGKYQKNIPQDEKPQADQPWEQSDAGQQAAKVIKERVSSLEQAIQSLESRKKYGEAEGLKKEWQALRLAAEANGEVGVLLQVNALQMLRAQGRSEITGTLTTLQKEVPAAQQKLRDHLQSQGMSAEEIGKLEILMQTEGAEAVLKDEGLLGKVKGLDELVFGRDMTEREARKLIEDKYPEKADYYFKKYGKKAGTGILLGLLLGVVGGVGMISSATRSQ